MIRKASWLLFGCFVASLPAYAAGNATGNGMGKGNGGMGPTQMPTFTEIDVDHDGAITQQEFVAFQQARQPERAADGRMMKNAANSDGMFEQIDADGNGLIDEQEFLAHRGSMRYAKPQQ
ncbi:EF-hand domain-containing protein [Vibrio fluvialis]|uniref:EF-hand domain-containing protein n=1 Tax=Vibrio fluvialis TaxID=676 RepID=UPI001EEC06D4|nr:EF-hand domain-containing protein [Vibrio fluvialis]MCG6401132.1 EF-hand domain-containing protein [Vibrio fluvialis]